MASELSYVPIDTQSVQVNPVPVWCVESPAPSHGSVVPLDDPEDELLLDDPEELEEDELFDDPEDEPLLDDPLPLELPLLEFPPVSLGASMASPSCVGTT